MPEPITYSDIVKAWHNKKIRTASDFEAVLSNFKIFFAFHSNKIEDAGASIDHTRESFENGKVINYTGDLQALFETENQKICYEFLKEKLIAKEPLSGGLIKQMHEKLTHGCYDETRWDKGERPGEYKKNYYGVGLSVGVPPEDVQEEVDYICKE